MIDQFRGADAYVAHNYEFEASCRAAFDVVVTAAIFEELIKKARWSERQESPRSTQSFISGSTAAGATTRSLPMPRLPPLDHRQIRA